jgi:hypothetical protein
MGIKGKNKKRGETEGARTNESRELTTSAIKSNRRASFRCVLYFSRTKTKKYIYFPSPMVVSIQKDWHDGKIRVIDK